MSVRWHVAVVLLACGATGGVSAEDRRPIPEHARERLALRRATLDHPRIEHRSNGPTSLEFEHEALRGRFDLHRVSVRGTDFELLVEQPDGSLRAHAPPPVRTYRGRIPGFPGTAAAVTLHGEALRGVFIAGGATRFVQPLPIAGRHVVYGLDETASDGSTCGVRHVAHRPDENSVERAITPSMPGSTRSAAGSIRCVEVAFDTDVEYFEQNGASVEATLEDIEAIVNSVNLIYERQFGIRHIVTGVIVRTQEPDPYGETDAEYLLHEMRNHWIGRHPTIPRDVVHMMVGREILGSTVGIAFVGTVCDEPVEGAGYGLSQSHFSENLGLRVALTAHELGHNWSAEHCDGDEDCAIMCSGIGSCSGAVDGFGDGAAAQIDTFAAGAMCAGGCSDVRYVDAAYNGPSDGTLDRPYREVLEGLHALGQSAGTLIIAGGAYNEATVIEQSVTLRTYFGRATLGDLQP